MISYNNNVICRPYEKKGGIRKKITSGVATMEQKTKLVGLEILEDAFINKDISLKKGSIAYIKEEVLHSTKQYSLPLSCDDMKHNFIMVNFGHIVFVKEK